MGVLYIFKYMLLFCDGVRTRVNYFRNAKQYQLKRCEGYLDLRIKTSIAGGKPTYPDLVFLKIL